MQSSELVLVLCSHDKLWYAHCSGMVYNLEVSFLIKGFDFGCQIMWTAFLPFHELQ
jgi:hypothetical protein